MNAAQLATLFCEWLVRDRNATIRTLMAKSTCNEALLEHPSVIAALGIMGVPFISPLSLLNGVLVSHGSTEVVAAVYVGDFLVSFEARPYDGAALQRIPS